MNNKEFKKYTMHIINLIKKQSLELKKKTEKSKENIDNYTKGMILGYYSIITLLKHQAIAFCIDQKETGLADIKPDVDLLGLHRNPDTDFGEDNWAIETMDEEKAKEYLSHSIMLLKEQLLEAKEDANSPKEDFEEYNKGHLMAYHSAISLLKQQASAFNIDEKEIGL